jgi:hypothetical protein
VIEEPDIRQITLGLPRRPFTRRHEVAKSRIDIQIPF